jgi:hypothetical protein
MSMRGWRIRRKAIAGLGLLALLLQLVVSFGHIHARDLGASPAPGSDLAINTSTQASGQRQIPTGFPDDDCPICVAMHMAASGLLPAPPLVVRPTLAFRVPRLAFVDQFNLGISRHILFRTRAPPLA